MPFKFNFQNPRNRWIIGVCIVVVAVVITIIISTTNNKTSDHKLENERPSIGKAITERFAFLAGEYQIEKAALFGDGNYAGVLLSMDDTIYHVVLAKTDDSWTVIGLPSISLTYDDFSAIPKNIIQAVNTMEIGL